MVEKKDMNDYATTLMSLHNISKLAFMFFMTVMMMNVLVAILSNVYNAIETEGKMEMS